MNQVILLARRYSADALITIAVVWSAVDVALRQDTVPTSSRWLSAIAVALIVTPLLGRRRFPFAAPALVWVLAAAISFAEGQLVTSTVGVFVAGLVATFMLGRLPDATQGRIGLVIVVSAAAILVYNSPNLSPAQFVFVPMQFGMGWLAGFALRERAAQAEAAEERATRAERERETTARIAVAEERARIARELHDVVAHAVSVMVLQVGAVRHKLPETLREDKEALSGVERTGRTALTEMRRLLGAMRHEGDDPELTPQPGLDSLDLLLENTGRAGLPVSLHVAGDPVPLPGAIDLSAYRIVQEGLTNALKHAGASRADVTIDYGPDDVRIEVRDDGDGGSAGDTFGYGLLGVRERVKIFGGAMSAGAAPEGGFVLSARLPLGGDRP